MKYKHEMMMGYRGLPFKVSTHSVDKTITHWHDHLEILVVLRGSVEIRVNDQLHILKEEDILMINSHEIHTTRKTEEDNILLLVQLDVKYYSKYYPELRNMIFENNYFKRQENKNDSDILKTHIAKIVWKLNKKNKGYRFSVGSEVVLLLSHVMRNSREVNKKESKQVDKDKQLSKIKEILDYINENFEKGITLNDIASRVYFSTGHLSRFFKEMMGISFQEYLDYIRIDKASELLLCTDKLIIDVAYESGLAGAKTLNRLFKDHFNCTPSKFRNEHENVIKNIGDKIEKNNKANGSSIDLNRADIFENLFKYLNLINFDKRSIDIETDLNFNKKNIGTSVLKEGKPFTDYWRNLTTFGRASEGLRSDVQAQLRNLQNDIAFKYIRVHDIFSDEMNIYSLDRQGKSVYDWEYVDKLFDFFREINIKPFIELRFTPTQLRSSIEAMSWWDASLSKSNDIDIWKELVIDFVKHCIDRYGIGEVEIWYFEIWNQLEDEQLYWTSNREEYFELYKETVLAIKSISKDLKVGGPSITNQVECGNEWIDEFLKYCKENKIPLDYMPVHIYLEKCSMDSTADILDVINSKVDKYIEGETEVHVTEWNSPNEYGNLIHDTCFMANSIIDNVLKCAGKANSLGYWAFTNVMEEKKSVKEEFHGEFGLMTVKGLKKPSYFAYSILSKLGDEVIDQGDEYIVTRKNENIQILTYNNVHLDKLFLKEDTLTFSDDQRYTVFEEKATNEVKIDISDIEGYYKVIKYKLDRKNGSVYDDWKSMGSPENMNQEELGYLNGRTYPKMTIDYLKIEGVLKDKIYTKPHGVDLIVLEKI